MVSPVKEIEEAVNDKIKTWTKAHSTKMSNWGDISSASESAYNKAGDELEIETINQQIEFLIEWAVSKYGQEAFVTAKEEFYLLAGKFFYDEPNYHDRSHYFMDYFLLDRQITDHTSQIKNDAPYFEYINSDDFALAKISPRIKNSMLDIRDFRHSIFSVKNSSLSHLVLIDLLTKEKINVEPMKGQIFHGLEKGQIFQSFVYNWNGKLLLSKGIVLHPSQSWPVILKWCKILRNSQTNQIIAAKLKLAKVQIESLIRKPQAVKNFYKSSLMG
jgi:hypothetical protein